MVSRSITPSGVPSIRRTARVSDRFLPRCLIMRATPRFGRCLFGFCLVCFLCGVVWFLAWFLDNPLYSLADEQENKRTLELWETEKHGGVWEGNNRLPFPFTFLIGLIVATAFLVTMPIWGQRPSAQLYAPMVALMDSPEVQALPTKEEKIRYLTQRAMEVHKASSDTRLPGLLERHPIQWDDLKLIADQVREIQSAKGPYGLESYSVLGSYLA